MDFYCLPDIFGAFDSDDRVRGLVFTLTAICDEVVA
jgi:hypothetical protein